MADPMDITGSAGGAAVGVGTAAAQGFMNPVSDIMAVTSLVGLGMSLFGTNKAAAAAKQVSADSQAIAGLDMQVNQQRQQQMVLQASRQDLQSVRNAQRARSTALTASVNQGANMGSGLQGGYGQISGETNTNVLSTNQNLEIGKNIFGLDNQIDTYRMDIAKQQGNQASGQGMQALGGDIMKGAPAFSQLAGNFFGSGSNSGGSSGNAGGTGGIFGNNLT